MVSNNNKALDSSFDDDDNNVEIHSTKCKSNSNTSVGTSVLGDDSTSSHSDDDEIIMIENHDNMIPGEVLHVKNDNTNHIHSIPSIQKRKAPSRFSQLLVFTLWLLITIILDTFLITVPLGLFGITRWVRHVHDHYLQKQLMALYFIKERADTDITYYERICDDVSDISTTNPNDVWLSPDATPEQAMEHQLKHGFTGFSNVLSTETATKLRDSIYYMNYNTESLYVIEQTNRFSVLLGTDEPIVAQALEEIANHPQFSKSIEAVLGPDPALIELTAISSSYGAVDQWWHEDVSYDASAQNLVTAFGTSYSVFFQLQDTTSSMGITHACPGMHLCSNGRIANICQKYGFPSVRTHSNGSDEDDDEEEDDSSKAYFKAGDALLMSSDSFHRGSAFTDPNAPDRIMFILSFSPKPKKRAETRQMSQGLTFQLRWDMWGHTLNDMKTAKSTMQYPLVMLKSLGLYKLPSTSWGIDYIRASSQRIINNDNGFRTEDLINFKNDGGFTFLPSFFHDLDEETWYWVLFKTIERCERYFSWLSVASLVIYFILSSIIYALFTATTNITIKNDYYYQQQKQANQPVKRFCKGFFRALVHVVAIGSCIYTLTHVAKHLVDQTGWAADLKAQNVYGSIVQYEEKYDVAENKMDSLRYHHINNNQLLPTNFQEKPRPSTLPTKHDVLIETKYGSRYLGSFRKFINFHPGNQEFLQLIENSKSSFGLNEGSTSSFQLETARYVVETIMSGYSGRFLYQLPGGSWSRISNEDALSHTLKELSLSSSRIGLELRDEIRYIIHDLKYGVHRRSALIMDHAVPYMKLLEKLVLRTPVSLTKTQAAVKMVPTYSASRYLKIQNSERGSRRLEQRRNTSPEKTKHMEPYLGAWLEEENIVEAFVDDIWYVGYVSHVSPKGQYKIEYPDGSESEVDLYSIRPFIPFKRGESIGVLLGDEYEPCTYLGRTPDGHYQAIVDETSEKIAGFKLQDIGRPGKRICVKPDRDHIDGQKFKFLPDVK